jgi:peroxidase
MIFPSPSNPSRRRQVLCVLALAGLAGSVSGQQLDKLSRPQQMQPLPPVQPPPPESPTTSGTKPLGGLREFRSIDGSGNNPSRPEAGKTGSTFYRLTPPAYADEVGAPSGADRPSARLVSNAVCAQTTSIPNRAGFSAMLWNWGQFLDHDLTLANSAFPAESFPIPVPAGDPSFDPAGTGTQSIPLDRTVYRNTEGIRQQINELSAYIDGSMVYGHTEERARALRATTGGLMRVSAGNLLPFNTPGLDNVPTTGPEFFLAGDIRANEQSALMALQTVFVREHNFWARTIVEEHRRMTQPIRPGIAAPPIRFPGLREMIGRAPLNDERIYQLAKAIVTAEIQAITLREFLPVLVGHGALEPYRGFKPQLRPDIRSEFSVAAYRFGHSTISSVIPRVGPNGRTIPEGNQTIAGSFFAVDEFIATGPDPVLRGLSFQRAEEIDGQIIDDLRNFLFGPPGAGGLDLASLNIQRGRDWGLRSYNGVRQALGLRPARTFAEISRSPQVQARLADAYTTVSLVDPWIGILNEDHVPGATVGETGFFLLTEQFEALRDGDRFWYERYLSPAMRDTVERQRLSVIMRRNTGIGPELQENVFRVPGFRPEPPPSPKPKRG